MAAFSKRTLTLSRVKHLTDSFCGYLVERLPMNFLSEGAMHVQFMLLIVRLGQTLVYWVVFRNFATAYWLKFSSQEASTPVAKKRLTNIPGCEPNMSRKPKFATWRFYPQSSSDSRIGASPLDEGRRWSFAEIWGMQFTAGNKVVVVIMIDFAC